MRPEYWTDRDVASMLSISRAAVWLWAREGRLPAPVKFGNRTTRWNAERLRQFLNEHEETAAA